MNDVVTTPPSDAKSTTPNPKWSPTPTDDGGASEVIVWSKETPSTVSTAPNASQRPSVVPQKPAFSPSPLILNRNSLAGTPSSTQAPAEENGWHFISSGQLVDDTGSQYDIAEQVMKLQISDDKPAPAKPLDTNSDQTKVPNGASEETETPSTSPHNDSYVLHTRGPSSDTSSSDGTSSVVTPLHLKTQTNIPVEDGERERNGYLSEAGVRLEALHSAQKEPFAAPPEFPSLQQHSHQTYPQVPPQQHGALGLGRPPHIGVVPGYDYRQHPHQHQHQHQRSDDLQVDYNIQPRPYGPGAAAPQAPQTFAPLPMHPRQDMPFRAQAPRGSISGGQYAMAPPPPSIIGSPPPAAYYQAPGLYDLVHPHPHQALRPTHHHHSASDPSSLRDIAAMHAMHSPPPMHPFTSNQGIYTPVTSPLPYGAPAQFYDRMPPPPPPPPFVGNYSMDGAGLAAGPSANNRKLGLYKTELCRSWEEKGSCRYGPKCQFAHGEEEIRKVARHPKYKTEICRTFWVSGSCPYGKRCCFIHTELPASGAPGAPGATGAAPADETRTASGSHPDGRARSMSTNSDPNDPPSSLLARISAKRNEAATTATTTGSANNTAEYASFGRPANGALRVDTAVENASKQNGGQYPYSSNPAIPAPGSELHHRMSPGPVTASADFGRGRIDVVGYNNSRIPPPNGHGHGLRHSFGGDTTITPITQRSTSGHSSPFSADGTPSKVSPAPTSGHGVPRNPLATGHSRSGSDLSMPWATQDMPARFERTWA